MKLWKRVMVLCLCVVLMAGVLCGCEGGKEKLLGTWYLLNGDTQKQADYLLEIVDLFPEELELIEPESLQLVKIVEFREDNTYRFAVDSEASQKGVREFYADMFDQLYNGREALSAVYEEDLAAMSQEEFQAFYASVYGESDFDALLESMTQSAYDYEAMGEDFETGTYRVIGSKILCTITGQSTEESLEYELEGNVLTLVYLDGQEIYEKRTTGESI